MSSKFSLSSYLRIEKGKLKLGVQNVYTVILRLRFKDNEFKLMLEDFAFHCLEDYLGEELQGKSFTHTTKKRNVRSMPLISKGN